VLPPPLGDVVPQAANSPGTESPAAATVARRMNVLRLLAAPAAPDGSTEFDVTAALLSSWVCR
jgi:hypothetical protein